MNDLPAFLALTPGVLAGLLIGTLLSRWARLLVTAFGPGSGMAGEVTPPRSRSAQLFAILHPVPWLAIIGLGLGVSRLRAGPVAEGWLWFWGAAIATPAAVVVLVGRALRARAHSRGRAE